MKVTWSQVRLTSSMQDDADLKHYKAKDKAKEHKQKLKMLAAAEAELLAIHRYLIRQRRAPFVQLRGLNFRRPRPNLRMIEQTVRYCRLSIARKKRTVNRLMKEHMRSAKRYGDLASARGNTLIELVTAYNGNNLFKLLNKSDINALEKVKALFPDKILRFSVGATVSAPELEEMQVAAVEIGLTQLCSSALFELSGGVFRRLPEAEAIDRGYSFRGVYAHV